MSQVHAADARLFDAELVIYRLEEAGATLLALPGTGWSTRLRSSSLEIVRSCDRELWLDHQPHPSTDPVGRADHPHGRGDGVDLADPARPLRAAADRRCPQPGAPDHRAAPVILGVGSRTALGADHKAVQRWHAQGIDLIVAALNRQTAVPSIDPSVTGDTQRRFGRQ